AACLMKSPRLSYCGVDELASVVSKLDLQKHRPLNIGYEWGRYEPSVEFAQVATINVYYYHKIGTELLARDW
ncbi:werner syndrome ATP-dependent helicase, partial [Trifolium medium]|nr:werner syndrome ATP-dependent helicase [Trifolium medium]